ncbi:MAG: hypothetical protein JSR45_17840 [Proteobacteria bacterium]|nr:hypothetical protein [Pseudomonadota bacterium]
MSMRVRGSGSIAAVVGGVVGVVCLAMAGTMVLGALHGRAHADSELKRTPGAPAIETVADEPAPGDGPEITPEAAARARAAADARALTAAVKPDASAARVNWEGGPGEVTGGWSPRFAAVERFAAKYEPQFDFQVRPRGSGTEARVQVAFGQPTVQGRLAAGAEKLGLKQIPATQRTKGRFFLFAAARSDAVGFNLFRSPEGEIRRAGWSAEKVAVTGDAQVGAGWRKGPLQASLGFVEREISSWGHTAHERFFGFTFSLSPAVKGSKSQEQMRREREERFHGRQDAPR